MNLRTFSKLLLLAVLFTFTYGGAVFHVVGDQGTVVNVIGKKNSLSSESRSSEEILKKTDADQYNLRGRKHDEDQEIDSSSKNGVNINIENNSSGTLTTHAQSTVNCVKSCGSDTTCVKACESKCGWDCGN